MMPTIAQIYLTEMVQEHKRNVFGTAFAISVSIGITLTYVCGSFMSSFESVCWVFSSIVVLLMILVTFLPDSPVYLMQSGKIVEAQRASNKLWGVEYNVHSEPREVVNISNYSLLPL